MALKPLVLCLKVLVNKVSVVQVTWRFQGCRGFWAFPTRTFPPKYLTLRFLSPPLKYIWKLLCPGSRGQRARSHAHCWCSFLHGFKTRVQSSGKLWEWRVFVVVIGWKLCKIVTVHGTLLRIRSEQKEITVWIGIPVPSPSGNYFTPNTWYFAGYLNAQWSVREYFWH
jgi:hypothetical protein